MQSHLARIRSCAALAAVLLAVVLAGPPPAAAHSALPDDPAGYAQLGGLLDGLLGGGGGGSGGSGGSGEPEGSDGADGAPAPGSGQPVAAPAAPGANAWTGPGLLVSPQVVVARLTGPPTAGVVMADRALPWTYLLDTALVERFGQAALQQAVAAWDGIPGSRWATRPGGTVSGVGQAVDGRSVIYLDHDCPPGIAGMAYLTPNGGRYQEYGDPTFTTVESDIAICAVLSPAHLQEVVRHEVGHVMGMAHLCDPGDACWSAGMGTASQACRIMFSGSTRCDGPRVMTEADRQAVRALYPTLRRAAGPTRIETAARASRGAHAPASADRVFLVRGDGDGLTAAATAAVAAQLDAPMLLAIPTAAGCVAGSAATELVRVTRPATPVPGVGGAVVHLVGSWPAGCADELRSRGYVARAVEGVGAIGTALALADLLVAADGPVGAAVVVSDARDADATSPDGIAAGAAAAAVGGPLLFTGRDALDARVGRWLATHGVDRVRLVGGSAALTHRVHVDAEAAGAAVSRSGGPDRIGTALALAGDVALFPQPAAVGIAAATSWADAASATAVAGREAAPVLLTGPAVDARVEAWLASRRAARGWVFGGEAAIGWATAARYTAHVG